MEHQARARTDCTSRNGQSSAFVPQAIQPTNPDDTATQVGSTERLQAVANSDGYSRAPSTFQEHQQQQNQSSLAADHQRSDLVQTGHVSTSLDQPSTSVEAQRDSDGDESDNIGPLGISAGPSPRSKGIVNLMGRFFRRRNKPNGTDLANPQDYDDDAVEYQEIQEARRKPAVGHGRKLLRSLSSIASASSTKLAEDTTATSNRLLALIDDPSTDAGHIMKVLEPVRDSLTPAQRDKLVEHSSRALRLVRKAYTRAVNTPWLEAISERWRKVPFADARSFREYLRKIDLYLKELVDLCEGHSALQTMSATNSMCRNIWDP